MDQMHEAKREFENRNRKLTYVLSTSATTKEGAPDNLLMWAHYGGSHKGLAFKFVTKPRIKEVKYEKELPPLTLVEAANLILKRSDNTLDDKIDLNSQCKSEDWKYENEWRFSYKAEKDFHEEIKTVPIEDDFIEAIYLGCRIPEEHEVEITSARNLYFPNAKMYKARVAENRFALEFEEINNKEET